MKYSVIVTHGNRIKNFLSSYGVKGFEPGNCCIIEATIKTTGTTVSCIYNQNGGEKKFADFAINDFKATNDEATIYIIRHGEGEHNVFPKMFTYRFTSIDPKLTDKGTKQANDAADFLFNGKLNGITDVNFGCSTLKRTQQTIQPFVNKIPGKTAMVLPYIHELGWFDSVEENEDAMVKSSKAPYYGIASSSLILGFILLGLLYLFKNKMFNKNNNVIKYILGGIFILFLIVSIIIISYSVFVIINLVTRRNNSGNGDNIPLYGIYNSDKYQYNDIYLINKTDGMYEYYSKNNKYSPFLNICYNYATIL